MAHQDPNAGVVHKLATHPKKTTLGWVLAGLVSAFLSVWGFLLTSGARAGQILAGVPGMVFDPLTYALGGVTDSEQAAIQGFLATVNDLVTTTGVVGPIVAGAVTALVLAGIYKLTEFLAARVGIEL